MVTGKRVLSLTSLIARNDGGQVAGQRGPEAGSGGAGVPVPEEGALSSCWISMVGRDPGIWEEGAVGLREGTAGLRPNPFNVCSHR